MPGIDTPSSSALFCLTISKAFGRDAANLELVKVGRKIPVKRLVLNLSSYFPCGIQLLEYAIPAPPAPAPAPPEPKIRALWC